MFWSEAMFGSERPHEEKKIKRKNVFKKKSEEDEKYIYYQVNYFCILFQTYFTYFNFLYKN